MRNDGDVIVEDVRRALQEHAHGGMVGAIVLAAELYDRSGEPQLYTVHSNTGTSWTHLGMVEVLRLDAQEPLRRNNP